jgi:hypothetical protein
MSPSALMAAWSSLKLATLHCYCRISRDGGGATDRWNHCDRWYAAQRWTTIKAFGDGTVKDGIGAHGWHIRPDLDLTHDLLSIESAAQTDGHEDTISSLRTESAAVLAALSHPSNLYFL